MRDDRAAEAAYVLINDVRYVQRQSRCTERLPRDEDGADPWSYHAKRGQGTIRLTLIEYRILKFLASRPNQALTRHRIALAVSTSRHCVTVKSLSRHIRSLRSHLGFFSDYIQSVPYIGYRFKA